MQLDYVHSESIIIIFITTSIDIDIRWNLMEKWCIKSSPPNMVGNLTTFRRLVNLRYFEHYLYL